MVQQREDEDQHEQLSSGGGSDSLSEEFLASPRLSVYMVKPISPPQPVSKKLPSGSSAKRPIDNVSKAKLKKKKRQKVSTLLVAEKEDDGTNKNGSAEGKEDEAKKASGQGKEEEVKKSYGSHNRVWREEDEIDLLKAIQEYKSKYGSVPNGIVDSYYDFTRKSVHVEFTKTHLYDKIRRLKKKYNILAAKSRKGSIIKLNPHENKLFHLAVKIWGKDETNEANDDTLPAVPLTADNTAISKKKSGGKVEKTKLDAKSRKQLEPATAEENTKEHAVPKERAFTQETHCHSNVDTVKERSEEFWVRYPYLTESLEVMKQSSNELTAFVQSFWLQNRTEYEYDNNKAKEIDEKWKKLEMEEMELKIKKVGLIQEHAKVALDAMKHH